MAFILSTAGTLHHSYANTAPRLSCAKFIIRDRHIAIDSILLPVTFTFKNWNSSDVASFSNFPLVPSLSKTVFRSYSGNETGHALDTDNEDSDSPNSYNQDWYEIQLDSEVQDSTIKIEIEKIENNSRLIRSTVCITASLQTVWNVLTDYERLAEFIPGLAVSQLLEKREKFARLFQIGEQNLPFGLKFNAKGTVDCFEKDLEILPSGHRRDIEFIMVDGDFQLFEGKWSVEQDAKECVTTLSYIVHVKPKMWLPVQLIEGRLCNEIKRNLSCIRHQAEKSLNVENSTVQ